MITIDEEFTKLNSIASVDAEGIRHFCKNSD